MFGAGLLSRGAHAMECRVSRVLGIHFRCLQSKICQEVLLWVQVLMRGDFGQQQLKFAEWSSDPSSG